MLYEMNQFNFFIFSNETLMVCTLQQSWLQIYIFTFIHHKYNESMKVEPLHA